MSLKIDYHNCEIILEMFERKYKVDVIYDLFAGEEITKTQEETADIVTKVIEDASDQIQQAVSSFLDKPKMEVCSLIRPKTIYIFRDMSVHKWALLADNSVDPENGLAVVFDGERLNEVTAIADII